MLPGIGFSIASCSAYITMKGVMMPGVSAGSNQVGASDTWIAQVSWPLRSGGQGQSRRRGGRNARLRYRRERSRRVMHPGRCVQTGTPSPTDDEAIALLLAAPLVEPCIQCRSAIRRMSAISLCGLVTARAAPARRPAAGAARERRSAWRRSALSPRPAAPRQRSGTSAGRCAPRRPPSAAPCGRSTAGRTAQRRNRPA